MSPRSVNALRFCTAVIGFQRAPGLASSHVDSESTAGAAQNTMVLLFLQYFYLQVLDFLSTVAFLSRGAHEGNPLVRLAIAMSGSPLIGLAVIKLIAVLLGIYCWKSGKRKTLVRVNIGFALLVTWNLVALVVATVAT